MTTGEKIYKLRREQNLTQEQLAEILGVTRQAVSRWESNTTLPETDKLIALSKLLNCSIDELLNGSDSGERTKPANENVESKSYAKVFLNRFDFHFEYKSKATVFGLPLVHVNIGIGKVAKGFFTLGLSSIGVVSLGLFSLGVISIGLLSLGVLALAGFALGVIGAGAISAGIFSFGTIAFGILSVGAVSIGDFSVGALAIGKYLAIGDNARGAVAIGSTKAAGSVYEFCSGIKNSLAGVDTDAAKTALADIVPTALRWISDLIIGFI